MKRFKSKTKTKNRFKYTVVILLVIFSFGFFLSYFSSFFAKKEVLEFMIESNLFSDKVLVSEETNIFDFLLDYTIGKQEYLEEVYIGTESLQEYTPDPSPEENKENPLIYLYSTHQGEEYKGGYLGVHDVIPTVMLASYRLREELNHLGINTIVETNPISEVLKINNWNYNSSYLASKILMTDAFHKNPTLNYFIDIHRDAIPYENSVITYEDKVYAKALFVIGTEHANYKENLALAEKLNQKLNEKVPNITRGILKKGGAGVNGIYNQDFSSNTLLIELGGQYNSINEITNTIHVLANSLKEVIE